MSCRPPQAHVSSLAPSPLASSRASSLPSPLLAPPPHKVHFGRLCMKPGKPTTFATVRISPDSPRVGESAAGETDGGADGRAVGGGVSGGVGGGGGTSTSMGTTKKVVFALPGNPVSSLVTFHVRTGYCTSCTGVIQYTLRRTVHGLFGGM